jgi:hypothetical protein
VLGKIEPGLKSEVARAAGPFLAATKFEDRLLVVLYQAACDQIGDPHCVVHVGLAAGADLM